MKKTEKPLLNMNKEELEKLYYEQVRKSKTFNINNYSKEELVHWHNILYGTSKAYGNKKHIMQAIHRYFLNIERSLNL